MKTYSLLLYLVIYFHGLGNVKGSFTAITFQLKFNLYGGSANKLKQVHKMI